MYFVTRSARCALLAGALLVLVPATALGASGSGHGGKPTIEREVIKETFFDDFIFDVCGVETMTTQRERNIIKTFPDGSVKVHRKVSFVPDDPRIASERFARTDFFAADGTLTIVGLAIRLYRKGGGGTIIRDAGWVRISDEGEVTRGPHPFLEGGSAAEDLYC
jgi:hypothetical protein